MDEFFDFNIRFEDIIQAISSRSLATSNLPGPVKDTVVAKWKESLWARDSVEPAMLRVPVVIVIFLFLWILNLLILEKSRIPFQNVISVKSAPISFTFMWALLLLILYALTMTIFSSVGGFSVEYGVLLYYCFVVVLVLIPGIPGQENKSTFFKLLRSIFFPSSVITFPEVLLADSLTSLSKIFKDFGITMVSFYASFSQHAIVEYHDVAMILIALLASLPFGIRVRQCWIQFENSNSDKLPILLNLLKYMTAFPPIWLAAAASLGYFHHKLPYITAVMATINSLYSFAWDVIMDWGFFSFSRERRSFFRPRSSNHLSIIWYLLAFGVNLLLRFSWAINRVPHLRDLNPSHLVLLVEVGEVFRRSIWNIFRIEWETIVTSEKLGIGLALK